MSNINIGDIGFDLMLSRDALLQFLIERGAAPPALEDLRRPYGWGEAFSLAKAHAFEALSDNPKVEQDVRMMARGAARALYEVCVHHIDVKAIELAAALEVVRGNLFAANRRLALSVKNVREMFERFGDDAAESIEFEEHREVLRMAEMLVATEGMVAKLAPEFSSRLLSTAVAPREEEGRPPQYLLTAVWHHLAEAGFEARESCTLIPDKLSKPGDDAMVRRVRFRLRTPVPKIQFPE